MESSSCESEVSARAELTPKPRRYCVMPLPYAKTRWGLSIPTRPRPSTSSRTCFGTRATMRRRGRTRAQTPPVPGVNDAELGFRHRAANGHSALSGRADGLPLARPGLKVVQHAKTMPVAEAPRIRLKNNQLLCLSVTPRAQTVRPLALGILGFRLL